MNTRPERRLPGHIEAALSTAGGSTDTAGQPWQGRELSGDNPYHSFGNDDGGVDPGVTAAREALAEGSGNEAAVVAALATARVFVPVVARLTAGEAHADGLVSDKEADMALVTLQAPDGRRALPVFSSTAALTDWHAEARPVAVHAPRAALSAVAEDAALLVLDPGTDLPFVVRRPALWALAQQRPWLPSYDDPHVGQVLTESVAAAGHPGVAGIRAAAGQGIRVADGKGRVVNGGGAGPELRVELLLAPGLAQAEVDALVGFLQNYWATHTYFAESVDSIEVSLLAVQNPAR
jgi:hypothetical protein